MQDGQPLIAVSGEYGIGKSSLLVRLRESLRNINGELCIVDCQGMSTHSPETFIDEIFAIIKHTFADADSWQTLAELSRAVRVALAIDDFGALTKAVMHAVVPHLCWLATKGITVIICAPDPIKHIRSMGINPKYASGWTHVQVGPFTTTAQVQHLLDLLTLPVCSHARRCASKILLMSHGRPGAVQVLCTKLSSLSAATTTLKLDAAVLELVNDPSSYTL